VFPSHDLGEVKEEEDVWRRITTTLINHGVLDERVLEEECVSSGSLLTASILVALTI
jgi:hypothetical protein